MKELITGISFRNFTKEVSKIKALLFYLEPDGTFVTSTETVFSNSIEEIGEGSYIVKSEGYVDYHLLDSTISGNSIFFCTSEDSEALYGTYINVINGRYEVMFNYKLKKDFHVFRALRGNYICTRDGKSVFINIDILRRYSKKQRRK